LTKETYEALSPKQKDKCVDIHAHALKVQKAIISPESYDYICRFDTDNIEPESYDEFTYSVPGGYVSPGISFTCWSGAEAMAELWRSKHPSKYQITKRKSQWFILEVIQLQHMYGVIQFELQSSVESHLFILDMRGATITVYNTYGGTDIIFVTEFDRITWLNMFVNFPTLKLKNQKKTYHIPWGFTTEMTTHNVEYVKKQIKYKELRYTRIY
jgi:hypothetical protein